MKKIILALCLLPFALSSLAQVKTEIHNDTLTEIKTVEVQKHYTLEQVTQDAHRQSNQIKRLQTNLNINLDRCKALAPKLNEFENITQATNEARKRGLFYFYYKETFYTVKY